MTDRTPPPPDRPRRTGTAVPLPVLQAPPPPASAPVTTGPWRLALLGAAPHRLGFFLGLVVLVAASGWWLAVQADRVFGWWALNYAVSPTVVHAVVMVLGFAPLFFAGFLFTAGPRWLGVAPPAMAKVAPPLLAQAAGWLAWLAGVRLGAGLALAGLALAWIGQAWMWTLFWRLLSQSAAPDRVHARVIGVAGVVEVAALAATGLALARGADVTALAWVRTGLWGGVVVVFVTVAHRMIPFFTANVVAGAQAWRPYGVLAALVGMCAFEVLAVWVDWAAPTQTAWRGWTVAVIVVEAAAGAGVLWLAFTWGLAKSLSARLLAMLHLGFAWLGAALLVSAASQALWLATGRAVLGLAALHALGMGFIGSVLVAMVTRVALGHSGRPLAADAWTWGVFCTVQLAVLLRLAGAIDGAPMALVLAAALLWTGALALWALRLGDWFGRPRRDGAPG